MALPILDGNQSAATLSTIITGGQHIPAHTVVSLGTQAISDIGSAVSGISISVAGTQSITGSVSVLNFPASQTTTFSAITGSVSVFNLPATQTVTFTQASVTFGTSVVTGSVSVLNFPATQAVAGTVTANLGNPTDLVGGGYASLVDLFANDTIAVRELPAISGTVTANVASTTVTVSSFPRPIWTDYSGSVVTANSSVTAISTITRSYLLAQVTTGQMFLNIGASCTTGNGVYFSAGQGFAWETTVPQGIVSIISGVTGTNYVLKDG